MAQVTDYWPRRILAALELWYIDHEHQKSREQLPKRSVIGVRRKNERRYPSHRLYREVVLDVSENG